MSSGPAVVMVLEGENAIAINRQLIGSVDPSEAKAGTIRADFGTDREMNAVHGSDNPDAVKREIAIFFTSDEILSESRHQTKS
jgi:nucleoside-diphosphate kinase